MTMPNFLLIGAAKSGTSSVYRYLYEHPEIYMSKNKEPNFFAYEGWQPDFCGPGDAEATTNVKTVPYLKEYQALFKNIKDEKSIGEASTFYLYIPEAAARIRHYIPEVKLIAILRHPVDRAYSFYSHLRRDGREPLKDFHQAFKEEEQRRKKHWSPVWRYQDFGFYGLQLQRYFERFDPKQIKVYLYEDLQKDAQNMIKDIFQFLEVDDTFTPNFSVRYNKSEVPKNRILHSFISNQNIVKSLIRPLIPAKIRQPMAAKAYRKNLARLKPLSPELRQELIPIFQADILKLQDLIGRDLSHWLV
ncbi:sulfotransferase [Roseofilum reptotaenium CS-1145]|uniref:Sulfotransferase n=1 Tax=Roseofilum reptotaenium AO1-A TaxID=1925591 RepID=A0A1L9QPR7_9CYAN|nr:sulfotransferase domain-containing protein [Roseofilum reptotaenium]MDB9516635.1 sulfotransferase [Roseofilum reptotaenium CS-1145]OJJ24678.1 sulfotransferase [Roseofilum reptotaenium AO1-A]